MLRSSKILTLCYVIFYLIIVSNLNVFSQDDESIDFIFDYTNFNKYRIEGYNTQSVFENGTLIGKDQDIRNNIKLEIISRKPEDFFLTYSMEILENGKLLKEEFSQFNQSADGTMIVPIKYDTPYVRNIPRFLTKNLSKGASWTAQGQDNVEILDSDKLYMQDVNVIYSYEGTVDLPQRARDLAKSKDISISNSLPLIRATYTINEKEIFNTKINVKEIYSTKHDLKIWWNNIDNRIAYYSEDFETIIKIQDGDELKFIGTADAIMIGIEKLDKSLDKIKLELAKTNSNIELSTNEKGITMSLEDIQFNSDSALLKESEKLKLQTIANILKRYPDRRFLIEGHTALAGTEEARTKLSTDRALAVLEVLQKLTGINRDQFLYKGWGSTLPKGSYFSEEEKAKNRRVEITILEN